MKSIQSTFIFECLSDKDLKTSRTLIEPRRIYEYNMWTDKDTRDYIGCFRKQWVHNDNIQSVAFTLQTAHDTTLDLKVQAKEKSDGSFKDFLRKLTVNDINTVELFNHNMTEHRPETIYQYILNYFGLFRVESSSLPAHMQDRVFLNGV